MKSVIAGFALLCLVSCVLPEGAPLRDAEPRYDRVTVTLMYSRRADDLEWSSYTPVTYRDATVREALRTARRTHPEASVHEIRTPGGHYLLLNEERGLYLFVSNSDWHKLDRGGVRTGFVADVTTSSVASVDSTDKD